MQNLKAFQVRWNDLDPTRHVANTSYSAFTNDTRVSFLAANGFTQDVFREYGMGPVVFSEEFHYIRELFHGEKVYVDVELLGNSPDYKFMKFSHCMFNSEGNMAAYSELLFGWFDLKTRKLIVPPAKLLELLVNMPKSPAYAPLQEGEMRNKKVPKRTLPAEAALI